MHIKNISRLIYKMKIVEQKITKIFEEKIGLSLTRYKILLTLFEKDNISQSEVRDALKIDNAAITRHIQILETKGYVMRERNPKNNREIFVSLTEKARKEILNCEHICPSMREFFGDDFSKADAENLLLLLEKFDKNIN